jgi:hypothetical protein
LSEQQTARHNRSQQAASAPITLLGRADGVIE